MSFISDLPFVDLGIDHNHYIRPNDRHGLVVNTHFYALQPYTTSPASSNSSTDGEEGSNHPDQATFISDLDVVDVGIDYDHYTRPSDPDGMTVNTHFRDLPPFTSSESTTPLSSMDGIDGSKDSDCETVQPSSFSSSKKPKTPKHPNAFAAYAHMMFGVLASAVIDRREGQEGDTIFIPDAGHTNGQIKGRRRRIWPYSEDQHRLEASKKFLFCTASAIPRFLFRGFHGISGGGYDPRLNSKTGVMPHAFLDGEEPTSLWDVDNLQIELTAHIDADKEILSHVSSWSQDLNLALLFATKMDVTNPKSPMLAVLDTESILEHVWYTTDLHASGLAEDHFPGEYHVYGPVSGPKYHCVPVKKLLKTRGAWLIMKRNDPMPLKDVVQIARSIAKVLRPRNATLDTRLILTAKFVGYHLNQSEVLDALSYRHLGGFLYHVRDILQALAMRSDARYISLAVPNVSTEWSFSLDFELQMLLAAENAVHILGWTWEAVSSRIYHPCHRQHCRRQLKQAYCKRVSWATRKRKRSTIPDDRPSKRQRLS